MGPRSAGPHTLTAAAAAASAQLCAPRPSLLFCACPPACSGSDTAWPGLLFKPNATASITCGTAANATECFRECGCKRVEQYTAGVNTNYTATDAACLYWSFVPNDTTRCEGQNLCAKFPGIASVEVATGNDANLTVSGHYPGPRLDANRELLPCPAASASQQGSGGSGGRRAPGSVLHSASHTLRPHAPPPPTTTTTRTPASAAMLHACTPASAPPPPHARTPCCHCYACHELCSGIGAHF
jgi:hypothetical protein